MILQDTNQQFAEATHDGRAYVISFCIPNLQCLAVNRLKPIQGASPCLQDTSGIGRYMNGRTNLIEEARLLKHLLKPLASDSKSGSQDIWLNSHLPARGALPGLGL
jgi:hypothetical protein